MVSANKEMVVYCFDTLISHYNGDDAPPPAFDDGQQNITLMDSTKANDSAIQSVNSVLRLLPLFVTWKKVINGGEPRLRGCIGTLEPRWLVDGFKDFALISALKDRRFPPIQPKELPSLECTVSILTDYETANDYLDWEIGKHGIIIEFTDPNDRTRRNATYLPEVAAQEGWTKTEAIDSLMRKASCNGSITDSLRRQIQLTRYQSTLFTMLYSEYVSYVKASRGEAPSILGGRPGKP